NPTAADFSNLSDRVGIYLDSVLHKTHIELDRNGTKAAAVTVVVAEVAETSGLPQDPKEVYLDRPFVYAIVEAESGIPLFIGCVNQL
ncbi:MAG: proteinase inhibitor I4 serpin, partial [Eubacterium sp.]|nr:proteinase inhibitor I4 serpin [Eubacterium sp.]